MTREFYLGYFTSVMVMSIYQDGLGMEKYIQHVRSGWMETSVWFWLTVLALGWFLFCYFEYRDLIKVR